MRLSEVFAEVETNFSSFAETGDIDRVSIKGWVITLLRSFGKNICNKRETIVDVKDSRSLLNEDFKSLILALRLESSDDYSYQNEPRAVPYKTYVSNPVFWDVINNEYVVNNCESNLITENLIIGGHNQQNHYNYQWLSLVKGMSKDTLDVNCYNIHPSIRDTQSYKISITNRSLSANFKTGRIYMQYNSLPLDEDGEIMIPEITTGDIKEYIMNEINIKLATSLILNGKNPQGAKELLPLWMQERRVLKIKAESEAAWNGISDNWAKRQYAKNRMNQNLYNLPKP